MISLGRQHVVVYDLPVTFDPEQAAARVWRGYVMETPRSGGDASDRSDLIILDAANLETIAAVHLPNRVPSDSMAICCSPLEQFYRQPVTQGSAGRELISAGAVLAAAGESDSEQLRE
jgi:carotenoid cleavage dioxygenase-like enzyme